MAPATRSRKRKDTPAGDISPDLEAATTTTAISEDVATPKPPSGRVLRSRSQNADGSSQQKPALASPPARRTRSKKANMVQVEEVETPSGFNTSLKENVRPNEAEYAATILLDPPSITLSVSNRRRSQSASPRKRKHVRGRGKIGSSIAGELEADEATRSSAKPLTEHSAIVKGPVKIKRQSMRTSISTPMLDVELQHEKLTHSEKATTQESGTVSATLDDNCLDANMEDVAQNREPAVTDELLQSLNFVVALDSMPKDQQDISEQHDIPQIPVRNEVPIGTKNTDKNAANRSASAADDSDDHTDLAASTTTSSPESNVELVNSDVGGNEDVDDIMIEKDSTEGDRKEPEIVGNDEPLSIDKMAIDDPPLLERPRITTAQNSPIYSPSLTPPPNAADYTDKGFNQSMTYCEQLFQYSPSLNGEMALDPRLMSSPPIISVNSGNTKSELLVDSNVSDGYDCKESSKMPSALSTVIKPSQRSFLEFSERMDKYNRLRDIFHIGHIPRSPSALAFYRRAYSDASSEAASEADDMNSASNRQESNTTLENPKSSPLLTPVSHPLPGPLSDSDGSEQFMDSFETLDLFLNESPPLAGKRDSTQSSDQKESSSPRSVPPPVLEPHIQIIGSTTPSREKSPSPRNPAAVPSTMPEEESDGDMSISTEPPSSGPRLSSVGFEAGDISDYLPDNIIEWEREQRRQEACWPMSTQNTPLRGGSPLILFSSGRSSRSIGSPMKVDSPSRQGSPGVKSPVRADSPSEQSAPIVAMSPDRRRSSPVKPRTPTKKSPTKMSSPVRFMSFMQRLSPVKSSPLKIVTLPDERFDAGPSVHDAGETSELAVSVATDDERNIRVLADAAVDVVEQVLRHENAEQRDNFEKSESEQSNACEDIVLAISSRQELSDAIVEEVLVEAVPQHIDTVMEESDSESEVYFDSVANVSSEQGIGAADGPVMSLEISEALSATGQQAEAQAVEDDSTLKACDSDSELSDKSALAATQADHEVDRDCSQGPFAALANSLQEEDRSHEVRRREEITESGRDPEETNVDEELCPVDSPEDSVVTIVPPATSAESVDITDDCMHGDEVLSEPAPETVSIEHKEDISEETTVGSSNYFASDENTSDIDYTTVLPWNISLDRWAELNKRQEKNEACSSTASAEKKFDHENCAVPVEVPHSPVRSPPKRNYVSTPARSSARTSLKRKLDTATTSIPVPTTSAVYTSEIGLGRRATRSHATPGRVPTAPLTKITETNSKLNTGFENNVIPQYQYKRGKRPESPPPDKRKRQRLMKNESPLKRERKIKFASEIATIAENPTSSAPRTRKKRVDLKPIIKVSSEKWCWYWRRC
ncbi:hypothetical protein V1517DRAFT_321890 [Lipomyces orientalis]|uniref:Uncharacterized protein n=1 Tax=Lipomyces orientalis TaxID=1233043 RepID=A0ACC3TPA8_9ASCO